MLGYFKSGNGDRALCTVIRHKTLPAAAVSGSKVEATKMASESFNEQRVLKVWLRRRLCCIERELSTQIEGLEEQQSP